MNRNVDRSGWYTTANWPLALVVGALMCFNTGCVPTLMPPQLPNGKPWPQRLVDTAKGTWKMVDPNDRDVFRGQTWTVMDGGTGRLVLFPDGKVSDALDAQVVVIKGRGLMTITARAPHGADGYYGAHFAHVFSTLMLEAEGDGDEVTLRAIDPRYVMKHGPDDGIKWAVVMSGTENPVNVVTNTHDEWGQFVEKHLDRDGFWMEKGIVFKRAKPRARREE